MLQKIVDFLHKIPFFNETVGSILAHIIIRDEQGKVKIDPKVLRTEAPRFNRNMMDEARFAQVMMKIPGGLRKALEEYWLPRLSDNQREDFILSIAEMTVGDTSAEKAANEQATVDTLTELGRIPTNARRTKRASALRFMKRNEEDYFLVKLERFAGRRFDDLVELNEWLRDTVAPELNRRAVNAQIRAQARRRWAPIYPWDPRVIRTNMNRFRRIIRTITGL